MYYLLFDIVFISAIAVRTRSFAKLVDRIKLEQELERETGLALID
jgi:hypothetical protein